jgi:hypothetical protein
MLNPMRPAQASQESSPSNRGVEGGSGGLNRWGGERAGGGPGQWVLGLGVGVGVLLLVLLIFFHRSFESGMALASNDGPLGAQNATWAQVPEGFTGFWQDLNWVGGAAGAALPSVTYGMLCVLKPIGYAKFYEPLCLLLLGLCAWGFFRAARFHPVVCVLGALAAALNGDLFSYTCWGLGSHAMAVACTFLALAALRIQDPAPRLLTLVLAGFAMGMGVMEGFDTGAILSLYLAAAVVFRSWAEADGGAVSRSWLRGVGQLVVVGVAAGCMAAYALHTLVGTQIKGVAGMEQDTATRQQRWDEATRWSLPKVESLRLIIAGLHGYRMDTRDGGNYWGGVGRDSAWEAYLRAPRPDPAARPHPLGLRHSGAGFYVGIFVVLAAFWAIAEAARGRSSVFSRAERRWIWFWAGAGLVSLLLAFGRHAPFYQFVYGLPYFSTIRNPIKFLHPLSLSVVILCGYGLASLLERVRAGEGVRAGRWSWAGWWSAAPVHERRLVMGLGGFLAAAVLGWMIFTASQSNLVSHLQRVGFSDPTLARSMARFSVKEVGWFVLFAAFGVGWVLLCLSGVFRGPRAFWWAGGMAGVILVADLGRANMPWVVYYNYRDRYASNRVVDLLRDRAHERRVTGLFLNAGPQAEAAQDLLRQVYGGEWMQHLFPFYNVASLEVVQEPRPALDNQIYRAAFMSSDPVVAMARQLRLWELTSTRHLLGLSGLVEPLNQQIDPGRGRFRLITGFELRQDRVEGPLWTPTNAQGPFGLIEFAGALPKVALHTRWETHTNAEALLARLVDPGFDPARTVLVEADPWPDVGLALSDDGGKVEFEAYHPKRIRLVAETSVPGVLLLNDKYHPDWQVTVGGRQAELFRANYLMRGVAVPPGRHEIEFRFRPPTGMLYVSLLAILTGLGLCAVVGFGVRRPRGP